MARGTEAGLAVGTVAFTRLAVRGSVAVEQLKEALWSADKHQKDCGNVEHGELGTRQLECEDVRGACAAVICQAHA